MLHSTHVALTACRGLQASASIGWFREGGGGLWGNVAEAPGKPFSPAAAKLARVLWIHYLSKARWAVAHLPSASCQTVLDHFSV